MFKGNKQGTATLDSVFRSIEDVRLAMLAKLKQSGLTAGDAKLLHMVPYMALQVANKMPTLPAHRAGFQLPYFTLEGRPTKFYRFRYLEYGHDKGFSKLVAEDLKKLRYAQPVDTLNELYVPPLMDWMDVALDKSKALTITEGELKAASATKCGYPTIGLGGVWCFKSTANRMPLLPMFEHFHWKDRAVYIVYDSDAVTNAQVVKAENALARELFLKGAIPYIVRLPSLFQDRKTGLDDYLQDRGKSAYVSLLDSTEPWSQAQELHALNEEVVYVTDPGIVLKLDTLQRMNPRAFIDHIYATRTYIEYKTSKDGKDNSEEKSAAKEWIKWPNRSAVARITYAPGEARITGRNELNTWDGWGVQPAAASVTKADVKPWQELLDYLFTGTEQADRCWFEQWLAYPLQHPGVKLYSAAVLWGIHQGTGKSLVGYTMMRIYGKNASEIGDRDLYNNFNEWAENKQFVMGDEIVGGDKRATADRMKSIITQRQLRINSKYVPVYIIPDCINYYFTSNHPDAFFLEDTDRRFFIHEVKDRPKSEAFYKAYSKWLEADGASSLFSYFLSLDLAGFNPSGHAPVTSSKREMISSGRSDLGDWVARLREDPDGVLRTRGLEGSSVGRALPYTLFTTEDLFNLYDPDRRTKVTVNGLGRELKRAGLQKVYNGMGVQTATAGQQRLWAVRNVEALLAVKKMPLLAAVYDDERKLTKDVKGGKNGEVKKKF